MCDLYTSLNVNLHMAGKITHQFFAESRLHVVGVGVSILQCVATLGRKMTDTGQKQL